MPDEIARDREKRSNAYQEQADKALHAFSMTARYHPDCDIWNFPGTWVYYGPYDAGNPWPQWGTLVYEGDSDVENMKAAVFLLAACLKAGRCIVEIDGLRRLHFHPEGTINAW